LKVYKTCRADFLEFACRFKLTDAAAAWSKALSWPEDPLWVESDWPSTTPLVRLIQQEPQTMSRIVLTAGLLIVTSVALLSWYAREERLQQ